MDKFLSVPNSHENVKKLTLSDVRLSFLTIAFHMERL